MGSWRTLIAVSLAVIILVGIGGVAAASKVFMSSRGDTVACEQLNQVASAALQAAQINQPALSKSIGLSVVSSPSPAPAGAKASITLTEFANGPTAGTLLVTTQVGGATCLPVRIPVKPLGVPDNSTLVAPTPTP